MEKIEETARRQAAGFLAGALEKALNSYRCFMEQIIPLESKLFTEYHNGCKAAIAHIQLLIKLAQWADLEKEIQQNENLSEVLLIAHAAVAAYRNEPDDDQNENDFQNE